MSSEFYSAFFMVFGGLAALFMLQLIQWYINRRLNLNPQVQMRLESFRKRFETRRRWSWAMVFVGTLWLVQLAVELQIGR